MVSKYNYKKELSRRQKVYKQRKGYLIASWINRDMLLNVPKLSIALTKVRNRCIDTGSSRSIIGKYKMGRIYLKKVACRGWLTGIRKGSW